MDRLTGSGLTRRRVLALVAVLAALYAVAAFAWIRHRSREIRADRFGDLAAIGRLKAEEIARWRNERLGDAAVLMDDQGLATDVTEALRDPRSPAHGRVIARLRSLCGRYGYADAQVVTAEGRIAIRVAPAGGEHEEARAAVAAALRERAPAMASVHRDGMGIPHTGVAAPVGRSSPTEEGPPAAFLLLSDAQAFLLPYVQSWPVPSASAETLLVERRGDEAVFLNELRFAPAAALALRLPLTATEVPAVQAVLGRTGSYEGPDYRGVAVLADLRPVPGTPWHLISKVYRAEILAPLRLQTLAAMLAVLALTAITGLGTSLIYKSQGKASLAARLLAERQRRTALEELRTTLRSIGDAVIATDRGGRVTLMNAVAEQLTGWSEAEAEGRPLSEVFHIVNEETRLAVEDPVVKVLRLGAVVGLANHTSLVARDGSERPIADSGAPVRDESGVILGVVLVFRDQTAERAAQRESHLLTSTIRAAHDEIYLFDADTLRFRFVNDGALRNLGYTADEVTRLTPIDLKPEFTPERFAAAVAPLRDGSQALLVFETVHERRDGSRYPVEVHLQLLAILDDRVFLAVIQDISERKRAEEALRRSSRALRTLSECNQALVRAGDEAALLGEVCRQIVEHGGYQLAWVGMARDDATRSVEPAAWAGIDPEVLRDAAVSWADNERGRSAVGTAIRERRTVAVSNIGADPTYAPGHTIARVTGYASAIALPIVLDSSTCLGALAIYAREVGAFDDAEIRLLEELATDLAYGLRTLRDREARAAAELALAASEERLRLALAAARQGIYDLDVQTGEAIVSAEYAAMLGYDPATFRETNEAWIARLHPDDREPVAAVYRAYIAGELPEYRVEFRQRTATGDWKWILSVGKVVERDADGRPLRMLGTRTDISDGKAAEEALREGEEKFSAAFHNSPIAMAMTAIADGTFRDVNDVFLRDSGYSREEVIGHTSGELGVFARPEDRDRLIAGVTANGRVYGMPCAFRMKEGRQRATLISTCPITVGGERFLLSAIVDISELTRAQEELLASRSALQAISDGAPVMICVVDEQRQVLLGNLAFRDASGWPDPDSGSNRACGVLGCINAHDHPDGCGFGPHCDECQLRLTISDTLATGQPHRDVECEISLVHRGVRRQAVVLASTNPFELAGQLRLVLCLVDITERRALEAQLRQAQRLEAVGTLAGGIAHDFNNLLQALLSSTQAARLQASEPAVVAALAEVQAQVRRGAALTRQLLLFARQTPAQHEPLDLATLVGDQAAMLRRLLPETIVLAVDGGAVPLTVLGDAGQLGQVVTNLVVNARDAMPGGGRIAVAVRRDEGRAVIEVSDTGAGISPETRDRMFDPFFTTKAQGKGTGLGLAVVWGIVKDHGGQVDVDSEPGRGSTFRVALPLSAEPIAAAGAPDKERLPTGHGERVLLIEDEDGAREGLAELLAALGYSVVPVASAEAAQAVLPGQPFDLLLTDYRLPGATGLDLARTLRVAKPDLRIVIMSGYAPGDLASELFTDGAAHFLQKPFDMAALAQALHDALAAPPRPLA